MAIPLFDLIKRDTTFKWSPTYYNVFELLKNTLLFVLIMVHLDLTKAFILNVDWFTWRVGAILL
jgi:hypothetical protein